jgi:hypothetical protein
VQAYPARLASACIGADQVLAECADTGSIQFRRADAFTPAGGSVLARDLY